MDTVYNLEEVDDDDWFSVEEAAVALNVKQTAIRNYLCDGTLTTYKFKTLTLISREEVKMRLLKLALREEAKAGRIVELPGGYWTLPELINKAE